MDPPAGRPNHHSSSTLPWSSLPPAGVDRPESFVGDRSCHGILGITLRQALEELLVAPQQESSPPIPTPPGGAPSRGKASHKRRNEDDDDDDDGTISSKDESIDPTDPGGFLFRAPRLEPDMVQPILNRLGRAMLETHEARRRNVPVSEWVSGLVRGRVQYYNRRLTKWRIVADPGAQLRLMRPRPRLGLCRSSTTTTTPSGQQPTLRRGADGRRQSLWAAAATASAAAASSSSSATGSRGGASGVVTLAGPLEILAHNDNE